MQPRLIRLKHAPGYLGMDRNLFNETVRPYLTTLPIGRQGIAFDRLELDAWADHYKKVRGRAPEKEASWEKGESQVSPNAVGSGTSTSKLRDTGGFDKAAARLLSKKRSGT
jgi:hypothetical protein